MKKRRVAAGIVVALAAGAAVFAARGKEKPEDKAKPPFRIGAVKAEDLQVSVREVGVIDPFTKVDVKSVVSGRIQSLRVREGARVKTGDVLAEVEPDVTQAQVLSDVQAAVIQAQVSLKDAERVLAAQTQLFESGLIGKETLKDYTAKRDLAAEILKAAETRYRIVENHGIPISGGSGSQVARVTSPMNGVVIKRGVELGDMVQSGVSSFNAGTVLFTVADLQSLIVRVNLNEVDIAKVNVGQPVRITLDAYPQKAFTGKVRFVAPAATLVEKIKVFAIEIALDELSDAYRTGMSANVEILGEKRQQAVSIPLEALQRREGQTIAYRLKKDLKPKQLDAARDGLSGRTKFIWLSDHWTEYFDAVPVDAGVATLERVEIRSGLAQGDEVSLEDPTRKKVEKDDNN
jgi:RND family efflux transporter MFP subunit